jgi:hypothetical protein
MNYIFFAIGTMSVVGGAICLIVPQKVESYRTRVRAISMEGGPLSPSAATRIQGAILIVVGAVAVVVGTAV